MLTTKTNVCDLVEGKKIPLALREDAETLNRDAKMDEGADGRPFEM